jgi:preprotein translocase SecE subunit
MARTTDAKLASRPAAKPARADTLRRLPAVLERPRTYLREVWTELHRVDWPARTELIRMSIVVLVVLLVMALYLGFFDYIFTVVVRQWLLPPTAP